VRIALNDEAYRDVIANLNLELAKIEKGEKEVIRESWEELKRMGGG